MHGPGQPTMTDTPSGMRKGLANYGDAGFSLFLRKAFIKAMGYSDEALDRPIVGITDTFSGYNACHRNVPDLIEAIKRGVMLAGGLPIPFPIVSIHESFSHPTSMFLRNLMAMDAEEMIRAQPMDAVVLIGGCDKTVPALLMAAASVDLPAILEVTGPMITGSWRGERLGACTDCRRFWAMHRAGTVSEAEIAEIGDRLAPGPGTCMVMGTASTMALVAEAMGMMLPGGGAIPAVDADRLRHAEATGAAAVRLAREGGPRPSEIMTEAAFMNALRVLQAIGGSTNGVIHLAAIAGRLGIDLDLDAVDRLGQRDAGAGRPQAGRPALHGGPSEGRRPGDGAARDRGLRSTPAARTVDGRTLGEDHRRGAAAVAAGGGAAARPTRSTPAAASACCTATSPRTARSSSRPRRRRRCSPTPAARWCSIRSTTWPSGSTTRTSTSRPTTCSSSGTPGRRARRECRRPATSRSRRSSPRPASRTWCASPTRG